VPLAVLFLGQSLLWAISGFSPVDAKQLSVTEDENDGQTGQEI
jgi:hypothetical protein